MDLVFVRFSRFALGGCRIRRGGILYGPDLLESSAQSPNLGLVGPRGRQHHRCGQSSAGGLPKAHLVVPATHRDPLVIGANGVELTLVRPLLDNGLQIGRAHV